MACMPEGPMFLQVLISDSGSADDQKARCEERMNTKKKFHCSCRT